MTAIRKHYRVGAWSAMAVLVVILLYVVTGAVWLVSEGDTARRQALTPTDPHLAIMESLMVIACPLMVLVMASVHAHTPPEKAAYSLAALSFMILLAGITGSIHFVQLVAIRRIDPGALPWRWPSVMFALDLFAWDLFFGLSMAFAALVFEGGKLETALRRVMLVSGALCITGLLGPTLGDLRFQVIAIVGYAGLGTVAFLLLSRFFTRRALSLR